MTVTAKALPPPLKWAGGKRWQLPIVATLWRAYAESHRLVEPFCGGLAIALGLQPTRAHLNDINPHVISFYSWLQRGLTIDIPLENRAAAFYAHRDRFNALVRDGGAATREAAALFYYLNRTSYNGLCRFNDRGEFNVPFGRYKQINYVTDFAPYRMALRGWQFSSADFAVLALDPTDFVYADPPYDVEFTKYSRQGFAWSDQVRTAQWCAAHAGPVVLVNQATRRICELYRDLGFTLKFVDGPRRISCTGDRTPAREVVAVRNVQANLKVRTTRV